jgi:hypothetical protein
MISRRTVPFLLSLFAFGDGFMHPLLPDLLLSQSQSDAIISPESEGARLQFFLWFFGASGGAGIARSAFPRMYKQVSYIQSLKGSEPTLGGETVGLSPLCGYPEDLSIKDIQQIASNKLNVEQIVKKYPVEGNFLARKGYLTFAAFEKANADANPLAVRAIFDTFAQSTDVVEPDKAQDLLDLYKEDPKAINGNLINAKGTGYAAILTLLFLLGLADITAAGHAYTGWFPDWPGGVDFPAHILDPEGSLTKIPDYWI